MKRQQWGRIINAASFAAIVPITGSAAYAASKAGVHYFTRVLAGSWALERHRELLRARDDPDRAEPLRGGAAATTSGGSSTR